MHSQLPLTTTALPTKREIRRIRNRLYLYRHTFLRLILPAAVIYLVFRLFAKRHPHPQHPSQNQHAFAACLDSPFVPLRSFDPFVRTQKAAGLIENSFENRFQEDIWDTLVSTALFPAWSDMRWNLPQYARSLSLDLAHVQALAERSQQPVSSAAGTLQDSSRDSPVQINYVHHRLDRLRGLQYLANFNPKSDVNKTYNLLVENSFDHPGCNVELSDALPDQTVYILLPYKDREARLRLFLHNYLAITSQTAQKLVLIVSVLRGSENDIRVVRTLKAEVLGQYPHIATTLWLHENDGDVEHSFSRGVALREAAKLVPNDDDVLFHCDVDMIVHQSFFDRCRHNTILGTQVYYPVFYSLYPYANAHPVIAERNGFWRKTSFGMTCMRKRDFIEVGAYNDAETRFHGWGSEDVYQFEKVRNTTNLVAFRAVDPGLMHRWHSKNCDPASEAYVDCMKTNFVTMGHPLRIGPVLLDSLRDVGQFFKQLQIA